MLVISLIVSALLLWSANWIVRRCSSPGCAMACTSLAFIGGPFFLGFLLPPVVFQAPLLYVAVVIWRGSHRGAWHFLPLSCGATLLAFACTGIFVVRADRDFARLRALYPYESLEGRVRNPKHGAEESKLVPATEARLASIESKIADNVSHWREFQLRVLHEYSVRRFVDNPGFGQSRMPLVSDWGLSAGIHRGPVPLQPGSRSGVIWSPGDSRPLAPGDEEPLGQLLVASIVDFVHPRAFGYFKDRRHVTGFAPHQFGPEVPEPAERWKVQRLELISLLLHEEPAVYVSDRLPAMNRMHDTPTRALDRFERFGLDTLKRGEDLFVTDAPDGLRMLGAVRSVKQCVECHGGGRGDLLGVFSYSLFQEAP